MKVRAGKNSLAPLGGNRVDTERGDSKIVEVKNRMRREGEKKEGNQPNPNDGLQDLWKLASDQSIGAGGRVIMCGICGLNQ